jgi:voltage-gated potassium channel
MSTPLSNGNGNGGPPSDIAALGGLAALVLGGAQQNGLDGSYQSLKKALREGVTRDPLDALVVTVLGGSFLFYLAEKDENPKVTTYLEALVYVSTCLSVGYADIFARTPAGRAIATAIMTVGPAMAAKALDPPRDESPNKEADAAVAVQKAIVDKLDAILTELKKK